MADLASVRAIAQGRVQGVLFRFFVAEKAKELGLTGYVRNLPTRNGVEVQAEGERERLNELITHLKLGPPEAKVQRVVTSWSKYSGLYRSFNIKY